METERKLVEYVIGTRYEDIPQRPIDTMKDVILNALGAIVAGATVQGCPEAVEQCKAWGGKEESTILIYGSRVPACNAAFANSFLARAVAVDDGMIPGLHCGATSVPTALAVAELVGGCNGKEFLTALVTGTEVAARLNFASVYDGFDPTGVSSVFAAAAIACRILGLGSEQTWDALGHAFSRCSGSFQGTIDGSVEARVIQGAASQGGIMSAQLAQRGITGPRNFLEGVYGYFHLYGRDKCDPEVVSGELGRRFQLYETGMKAYPSCTATHTSIDAIFRLMEEKGVTAEEVAEIKVTVAPEPYNSTGKPFQYGEDPRISAMYSIQYCVANVLLRRSCRLQHFDESYVKDSRMMELIQRIHTFSDPALEKRYLMAADVEVRMKDGAVYRKSVDFPRGKPQNPMTKAELKDKFRDCVAYGGRPLPAGSTENIVSLVERLEEMKDVRGLIPLLLSNGQE